MGNNCLNCSRFVKCDYKNKRASYVCDSYKPMSHKDIGLFEFEEDKTSSLILPKSELLLDSNKLDSAFDSMEADLDEALENKLPIPKDFKFDDREIPLAKNLYDFIVNPVYGFKESKLFSRQLWMGIKLFGEWCQPCTLERNKQRHGKSRKPMKDILNIKIGATMEHFVDRVQLLEYGICPCCGKTRLDLYKKKELKFYTELGVCAGQRAGKSIFTSFLFAYHTHRLLKLQKPAELLTGASNTLLTLSVISIDKGGVMRNLWLPFYAALDDSKWFGLYHEMLASYGKRFGEEGFKKMDTFLHYRHRKMYLHPTVPNQRGLRGATRAWGAIDEIGWLDAHSPDKITLSADGIYEAVNRSMLTVRTSARSLFKEGYFDMPTGLAVNISSPSSQDDKIMQIVTKHSHSKTVLTVHAPTWKLNPKVPRDDPEIEKAYAEDPVSAERDYGANPPARGGKTFFNGPAQIQESFTGTPNKIEYQYKTRTSKKEEGKIYKAAECKLYPGTAVSGSVLAIDAGYSDNSFAIACGHWENLDKKDSGKFIQFDVLAEIIPNKGVNYLHHARISKMIIEQIIRAFNVKYVVADRWNSLYLLHKYMDDFPQLILAEQYSVKYNDFVLFRSYTEHGGIRFPKLETNDKMLYVNGIAKEGSYYPNCFDYMPVAHLFYQMMTVQDAGKTVEKAHKKTDDLFRATVLASAYLLDEDIIPFLKEKRVNGNRGIVALASGGTASTNIVVNSRGKGIAAIG